MEMPPEVAYEEMAEQITNEQVAAIQREIDDKKAQKTQKKRRRQVVEETKSGYQDKTQESMAGKSMGSIKTSADQRASAETLDT